MKRMLAAMILVGGIAGISFATLHTAGNTKKMKTDKKTEKQEKKKECKKTCFYS